MAQFRVPGPIGFDGGGFHRGSVGRTDLLGPASGEQPGPIGRTLWQKQSPGPSPAPTTKAARGRALIVIGTGHDGIKKGVRRKGDDWFDKAALGSFGSFTTGLDVKLVHVDSADAMKAAIENGPWDVVVYFGHGVENQMALAPKEMGRVLKEPDLAAALKTGQAKKVYLFGCKSGMTGLARQLSKDVPGATVYGTFGSLDVEWEQRMDPDGTFTNKFNFKEPLTEYTGGFQTENGKKTAKRRQEMRDPISVDGNPFEEPMVPQ